MGQVGGPRHYGGAKPRELTEAAWECKACGTTHLTPMANGCPSCGNGTAQQAEAARRAPKGHGISDERLLKEVVAPRAGENSDLLETAVCLGLTGKARITLAVALAHYADHGQPSIEELPRGVILAWGQKIASTIDDAPAPTVRATPDDTKAAADALLGPE